MWCVSCACTRAIEFESCQGRARQAAEPEGGGVLPGGPRARRLSLAQRELALSLAQREICAATRPGRKKERKKTHNPREGWENGTPPPHRDFKERRV